MRAPTFRVVKFVKNFSGFHGKILTARKVPLFDNAHAIFNSFNTRRENNATINMTLHGSSTMYTSQP